MAREFWINMFLAPSTDGQAFVTEKEAMDMRKHGYIAETIHVVEAPPRQSEGPFCKDCRHFKEDGDLAPKCLVSRSVDPVYGVRNYQTCIATRDAWQDRCGPGGSWFEPKEGQ